MKKITLVLLFICSISAGFAQVKRAKPAPAAKAQDSAAAVINTPASANKKEMMRELNLSKEQKIKLKAIKQEQKAKIDEVKNDPKLSADEQKAKLKALRMEQLKQTMAVLNDEQKARFKELRKQNKHGDEDALMEEKK